MKIWICIIIYSCVVGLKAHLIFILLGLLCVGNILIDGLSLEWLIDHHNIKLKSIIINQARQFCDDPALLHNLYETCRMGTENHQENFSYRYCFLMMFLWWYRRGQRNEYWYFIQVRAAYGLSITAQPSTSIQITNYYFQHYFWLIPCHRDIHTNFPFILSRLKTIFFTLNVI